MYNALHKQPERKYFATQDRNTPLKLSPHYLHDMPMFETDQIVFGVDTGDLHWDYSDRLWQWDWDKAEVSWKIAGEIAAANGYKDKSANHIQAYLTAYFDKPIELVCVVSGVNRSNGYPYSVYGYRYAHQE